MADISAKAEHVRRARQTRGHRCHWPGCQRQVKPALWGCRPHWYALPKHLRDRVWAAYRPGQEETGLPSAAYIAVARDVQAWIFAHHPESLSRTGSGTAKPPRQGDLL